MGRKIISCSTTSFVGLLCLLISVATSFPSVTYRNQHNKRLHQSTNCYRCNEVGSKYLSFFRGHLKKQTAIKISHKDNTVRNSEGDGTATLTLRTNANNDAITKSLQGKTVKELIHIAKNFPEYTSKIRLKKDLIEFVTIQQQQQQQQQPQEQQQQQKEQQRVRQKRLPKMPSYQPTNGNQVHDSNVEDELSDLFVTSTSNETGNANDPKRSLSKKELLYDFVIHRYPPLQHMSFSLSSPILGAGVDMQDIRALHHPMLTFLNKTSSDLDIVLIGTASCVPSSTRGVSCTALRLNWRRNKGQRQPPKEEFSSCPSSDQKQNYYYNEKDYVFESGTWLFDCGECTQVSTFYVTHIEL
jgi:hypothetical protein